MSLLPAFRIGGEMVADETPNDKRKQLAELLGKWVRAVSERLDSLTGGTVALTAANFVWNETPTATVNPRVFTLADVPEPPESLQLFMRFSAGGGWLALKYGEHYTLAEGTFTYDSTPATGFKHYAHYMVAS